MTKHQTLSRFNKTTNNEHETRKLLNLGINGGVAILYINMQSDFHEYRNQYNEHRDIYINVKISHILPILPFTF
jgi:hypothetical protein